MTTTTDNDDHHHHDESESSSNNNSSSREPLLLSSPLSVDPAAVAVAVAQERRTFWNFCCMSILFSANHGCVVACLALASARLGSVGAWQSGVLYITYTGSALLGATYVVKRLGARYALVAGMGAYAVYVAAFWLATEWHEMERAIALTGAGIGGIGAGFLWIAQGAYFAKAAEEHAAQLGNNASDSTATFASVFAFLYLAGEVGLRSLSTLLIQVGLDWTAVFGVYALVTILSTFGMLWVRDYDNNNDENNNRPPSSVWYKVTAALQLLLYDPKMKYMIGLNAVFGFCAAFVNSYVNAEVVRVVLNDDESKYVGLLTAGMAAVAAVLSIVFGRLAPIYGNGPILVVGALSFMSVALLFVIQPVITEWTWLALIVIYVAYGAGRATFEGALKATFADFFSHEKEGAFANIILQNGLSSAIGYVLTFSLLCNDAESSPYCVRYSNGTLHDVLTFELLVVAFAVLAILGYWRAAAIHTAQADAARSAPPAADDDRRTAAADGAASASLLSGEQA